MNSNRKLTFLSGLMCLPKGVKEIITDYKIFLFTLIPMLLGIAVVALGFNYGWDTASDLIKGQLTQYVAQWVSKDSYVFKFILYILNFIVKALLAIIVLYLGFVFVQIVSIPFYSFSCERILVKRNVFPSRRFSFGAWARLAVRMFVVSIIRMAIFIVFGLSILLLSLIPGLQMLALAYSAYVISLDCIDYTLEVYEMNLGRRFSIYFGNMKFFTGVAITLLPSLFVPGVTLLLLPIAVVGSAVCFAEAKGKEEYENLIA